VECVIVSVERVRNGDVKLNNYSVYARVVVVVVRAWFHNVLEWTKQVNLPYIILL